MSVLRNTTSRYGLLAVLLHWISACLVIGLFALGLWMVGINYYDPIYQQSHNLHKGLGILLLALTSFRLAVKLLQVSPTLNGPLWKKVAVRVMHTALYALLFGLFFTGYLIATAENTTLSFFSLFTIPSPQRLLPDQWVLLASDLHLWLAYMLIGAVILHVVATLKHHLIDKDDTLKRILFFK